MDNGYREPSLYLYKGNRLIVFGGRLLPIGFPTAMDVRDLGELLI